MSPHFRKCRCLFFNCNRTNVTADAMGYQGAARTTHSHGCSIQKENVFHSRSICSVHCAAQYQRRASQLIVFLSTCICSYFSPRPGWVEMPTLTERVHGSSRSVSRVHCESCITWILFLRHAHLVDTALTFELLALRLSCPTPFLSDSTLMPARDAFSLWPVITFFSLSRRPVPAVSLVF